jgi:hypothetical protein
MATSVPQWPKGGMTSNHLRDSGNVLNYFYTPGRPNIIPNPSEHTGIPVDDNGVMGPINSIGLVQTNGMKQISSGRYGPGSLLSTNIAASFPVGIDDKSIGFVQQNDKRSLFADYRNTEPFMVEQLRNNPLSIYSTKDGDVPAFFSFIKPENFGTYISDPFVEKDRETIELQIDGSPNVSILNMGSQNPFMGITNDIPNSYPNFTGKTYGGGDEAWAKPYAEEIYNQGYTTDNSNIGDELTEQFTNGGQNGYNNGYNNGLCQNKALSDFAQGYNIAPQLLENKIIVEVDEGHHAPTNLPYGPAKVTGNPWTQEGGIWQDGNKSSTKPTKYGYRNTVTPQPIVKLPNRFVNPYKNGLPGNLIS